MQGTRHADSSPSPAGEVLNQCLANTPNNYLSPGKPLLPSRHPNKYTMHKQPTALAMHHAERLCHVHSFMQSMVNGGYTTFTVTPQPSSPPMHAPVLCQHLHHHTLSWQGAPATRAPAATTPAACTCADCAVHSCCWPVCHESMQTGFTHFPSTAPAARMNNKQTRHTTARNAINALRPSRPLQPELVAIVRLSPAGSPPF